MKPFLIVAILIIAQLSRPDAVLSQAARSAGSSTTSNPSPYLFIWAGDDDQKDSDFLAVIDA
ncbi:MAG: hypothetical protein WAL47_18595, partial [Pyrinomonadaceae bacterium]